MNPFRFATALSVLIGTAIPLVSSVTVPGADTPLFYLVSSSSTSFANLLPVRMDGAGGGFATLSGSGPIGKFYLQQGQFTALDPAGTNSTFHPLINAVPILPGCSTFGALRFIQGSNTNNTCAITESFQIQSNTENSQLGAKFVLNNVGGFYACGSTHDVWYKKTPEEGPSQCFSADLYTVPVV